MVDLKSVVIVSACDEDYENVLEIMAQKTSEFNCSHIESIEKLIVNFQFNIPDILIIDSDTICIQEAKIIFSLISKDLLSTIVISSNVNHAVDCFDLGYANDFLLKPILGERLILALNRVLLNSIQRDSFFKKNYTYLKEGRTLKKFFWDDIIYIEGYGIYSKVYTHKSKIVVNESISSVLEKLPSKIFKRIQKSYIINTTKIVSIKTNVIDMEVCELPIGAMYKPSIEKFIGVN